MGNGEIVNGAILKLKSKLNVGAAVTGVIGASVGGGVYTGVTGAGVGRGPLQKPGLGVTNVVLVTLGFKTMG